VHVVHVEVTAPVVPGLQGHHRSPHTHQGVVPILLPEVDRRLDGGGVVDVLHLVGDDIGQRGLGHRHLPAVVAGRGDLADVARVGAETVGQAIQVSPHTAPDEQRVGDGVVLYD